MKILIAAFSTAVLLAPSMATVTDMPANEVESSSSGGCPMKKSDGSYPAMPGFGSLFQHPPVPGMPSELTATDDEADDETSDCPAVQGSSSQLSTSINVTVQPYDVYSRPLELDPTNNMPLSNPDNVARNSLPSKEQIVSLPTERVSSTIPKGGTDGETWTYPSISNLCALKQAGSLFSSKVSNIFSRNGIAFIKDATESQ